MISDGTAAAPVLVYNRIARNRRRTWLLIGLALLALAPFVAGLSYWTSALIVGRAVPNGNGLRMQAAREEAIIKQWRASRAPRSEWDVYTEEDVARRHAEASEKDAENASMRWKCTPVVAIALIAVLGILFWGIAASPTARLLAQAGARPAGEAETEARRLLENLCIGAGLPVPKLYVIEASAPNAFAAGWDAERAVVVVTRGALGLFDRRELEGVLAHELSHIGNQDIRLNTIVASIALFLRIPYLMVRRELATSGRGLNRQTSLWLRLALSPLGIYVFVVAPVVGSLIRGAVSREREFLADADAALLTRYPEGLLRALAKVGGAGSALAGVNPAFAHFYFSNPIDGGRGWFSGKLLATHPPLGERIERLAEIHGPAGMAGLEAVVEEGRKYVHEHPVLTLEEAAGAPPQDELSALNQDDVMGRVYRLMGRDAVAVYETPTAHAAEVALIQPGSLLVVFDDPGPMRQIITADQTFGYINLRVKLKVVPSMIPAEVFDPKMRAAAESKLAAKAGEAASRESTARAAGLSGQQIGIAVGFGIVVFGGMMFLLVKMGG